MPGKTIESIVKHYALKGQDVKELAKLNGLDPQKPELKLGKKIKWMKGNYTQR